MKHDPPNDTRSAVSTRRTLLAAAVLCLGIAVVLAGAAGTATASEAGVSAVEDEAPLSPSANGNSSTTSSPTDTDCPAGMDGQGTFNSPCIVTDVDELEAMGDDLDLYYELGNDIDASATASWPEGFDPIGSLGEPFTGALFGQGHTIEGLEIDRPDEDAVGLFGATDGATVQNVHLEGGSIVGGSVTGAIVGNGVGVSISQSSSDLSVQGSGVTGGIAGVLADDASVTTSTTAGSVSSDGDNVGGIAGQLNANDGPATVTDSYSSASVSGEDDVGGVVGSVVFGGEIERTHARGPVDGTDTEGGVVATVSEGSVSDSHWDTEATDVDTSDGGIPLDTAEMTGSEATNNLALESTRWAPREGEYPVLGFEYEFAGSGTAGDPHEVDTVYDLQAIGTDEDHLERDYLLSDDIDASVTANWHDGDGFRPIGVHQGPRFEGSLDGNDHEIRDLTVRGVTQSAGLFLVLSEASVSNLVIEDIDVVAEQWGGGLAVRMTEDTEVTAVAVSGTVEVTYEDDDTATDAGGIVGAMEFGATMTDSTADVAVDGHTDVGGLAGRAHGGPIVNSTANGDVTAAGGTAGGLAARSAVDITDSMATGDVTSSGAGDGLTGVAGGLVGFADGTAGTPAINRSSAHGAVTGGEFVGGLIGLEGGYSLEETHADGSVTGDESVGGLIGLGSGTLTDSAAHGAVTGDDEVGGLIGRSSMDVEATFATGTVDGSEDTGGLIGNQTNGLVVDSYWDVQSTEQSDSDGDAVTGLTTDQMTGTESITEMAGLDFGDTWVATDGYPVLREDVAGLELTLAETELEVGETTTATVTLTLDRPGTVTASETADYASSDEDVVTVSAGTVEAEGAGDATVTATLVHADDAAVTVASDDEDDDEDDDDGGSAPLPPPPPDDPEFALTTLQGPSTVEEDSSFTMSVTLENVGDGAGSTDVIATFADQELTAEAIELQDGEEETLEFEFGADVDLDSYDLAVEETHGGETVETTVTVEAVEEDDDDDSPVADDDTDDDPTVTEADDDVAGDADDDPPVDDVADDDDDDAFPIPGFGPVAALIAIFAAAAALARARAKA